MTRDDSSIALQSGKSDRHETLLTEYAGACRRRIWFIVAMAVGCAAAAAGWSFMQIPQYQAKATVVVEQVGSRGFEYDRNYGQSDLSPEYFQTQFELMKSHYVFQRTAELLRLSEQSEYQRKPSIVSSMMGALSSMVGDMLPAAVANKVGLEGNTGKEVSGEGDERLLKRFAEAIEIVPIRGARLAHVIATSEDPEFAAHIANTLASTYIERTQELTGRSKEKVAEWYTTHLDELRKKAETSQRALYQFRVKHGLMRGSEQQAARAHTNTELDSELVRAEMKQAEAKSRLEQIESVLRNQTDQHGVITIDWSSLDASTEVLSSTLIQTLRAQEIRVSGQVAELEETYGPLHPKLLHAKAEMQDLRGRIEQEIQKIFDSVKHEYDAAGGRVRVIKEAAGRHRQEKIKLEQYEVDYGILEREAESTQHLYDIFLKQTNEADLSAERRTASVYLADPAVPNPIPVKPKHRLNTLLGLLVGIMTGVGLALFLEGRDRTLKGPDDLGRYLPKISLLGVMPLLPISRTGENTPLLTSQSLGVAAEHVRIIRTSVLLSRPDELPSCILITSAGEGEGKTTLSVNLAMALAQLQNTRVVLIDADLRKPAHKHIYGVQREGIDAKGLTNFLSGGATLKEVMYQTDIANLSVIPRGERPSNPSELLHSKQLKQLLSRCRDEGYHVILDAPPVLPVTDPVILASQVDGVLVVASAGQTTREDCRSAIDQLTSAGGKILGIVLQKVPVPPSSYDSYVGEKFETRGMSW